MKTLLGLALTLALVIPSGPANAELLKNVKLTGSVDIQAVSGRNVQDFKTSNNDRLETVGTRLIGGLAWDLLDDVHAKVTLRKNNGTWGNIGATAGQQAGGSEAVGTTVGSGVLGNLFLQEAWVKIDKLFGHLDTTAGRQFWGESGDLIAFWGPKNTYGLPVTAIDALSVMASNDWVNFMGVAGKTTGNVLGATPAQVGTVADVDVRGVDLGWKMLPVKVNTFVWNRVGHALGALGSPAGLNDNLWVYGLKLRGEAMGGWAQVTAAANSGQNRGAVGITGTNSANYSGKALLVDAGYKLDVADVAGITPWGNFGWGSGRKDTLSNHNETFQSIASDYRPGVIYGRFNGAGLVTLGSTLNGSVPTAGNGTFTGFDSATGVAQPGLGNRIIWGGGLKVKPAMLSKLTAGASFWDFSYQHTTAAGAAAPAAAGNRHIGSELDFQVDWAHSDNVSLDAGWATFQPGGFVRETAKALGAGTNPVTLVFGDVNIRF